MAKKAVSYLKVLVVIVVNLVSRPPWFLGYSSSDPEGLGSQYGANFSKRVRGTLNKGSPSSIIGPQHGSLY